MRCIRRVVSRGFQERRLRRKARVPSAHTLSSVVAPLLRLAFQQPLKVRPVRLQRGLQLLGCLQLFPELLRQALLLLQSLIKVLTPGAAIRDVDAQGQARGVETGHQPPPLPSSANSRFTALPPLLGDLAFFSRPVLAFFPPAFPDEPFLAPAGLVCWTFTRYFWRCDFTW